MKGSADRLGLLIPPACGGTPLRRLSGPVPNPRSPPPPEPNGGAIVSMVFAKEIKTNMATRRNTQTCRNTVFHRTWILEGSTHVGFADIATTWLPKIEAEHLDQPSLLHSTSMPSLVEQVDQLEFDLLPDRLEKAARPCCPKMAAKAWSACRQVAGTACFLKNAGAVCSDTLYPKQQPPESFRSPNPEPKSLRSLFGQGYTVHDAHSPRMCHPFPASQS